MMLLDIHFCQKDCLWCFKMHLKFHGRPTDSLPILYCLGYATDLATLWTLWPFVSSTAHKQFWLNLAPKRPLTNRQKGFLLSGRNQNLKLAAWLFWVILYLWYLNLRYQRVWVSVIVLKHFPWRSLVNCRFSFWFFALICWFTAPKPNLCLSVPLNCCVRIILIMLEVLFLHYEFSWTHFDIFSSVIKRHVHFKSSTLPKVSLVSVWFKSSPLPSCRTILSHDLCFT